MLEPDLEPKTVDVRNWSQSLGLNLSSGSAIAVYDTEIAFAKIQLFLCFKENVRYPVWICRDPMKIL